MSDLNDEVVFNNNKEELLMLEPNNKHEEEEKKIVEENVNPIIKVDEADEKLETSLLNNSSEVAVTENTGADEKKPEIESSESEKETCKKGILKYQRTYSNKHVDFNMNLEFVPFDETKDYTIEIQIVEQMPKKIVSYAALFEQQKKEEEERKRLEEETRKKEAKQKRKQGGKKKHHVKKNVQAPEGTRSEEILKESTNKKEIDTNYREIDEINDGDDEGEFSESSYSSDELEHSVDDQFSDQNYEVGDKNDSLAQVGKQNEITLIDVSLEPIPLQSDLKVDLKNGEGAIVNEEGHHLENISEFAYKLMHKTAHRYSPEPPRENVQEHLKGFCGNVNEDSDRNYTEHIDENVQEQKYEDFHGKVKENSHENISENKTKVFFKDVNDDSRGNRSDTIHEKISEGFSVKMNEDSHENKNELIQEKEVALKNIRVVQIQSITETTPEIFQEQKSEGIQKSSILDSHESLLERREGVHEKVNEDLNESERIPFQQVSEGVNEQFHEDVCENVNNEIIVHVIDDAVNCNTLFPDQKKNTSGTKQRSHGLQEQSVNCSVV